MNYAIYRLINPLDNSTIYVGQTTCGIERRFKYHLQEAFNRNSTQPIHKFIKTLKEESGLFPKILLLENCTKELLDKNEKKWIKYYVHLPTLLNVRHGRPELIAEHQRTTKTYLTPSEIVTFDKDGIRKEYTSIKSFLVELELDYIKNVSTVTKCCKKKIKSFKGFKICYKKDEEEFKSYMVGLTDNRFREVWIIEKNGEKTKMEIGEALKIIGVRNSNIKRYINQPLRVNGYLISDDGREFREVEDVKLHENGSTIIIKCIVKDNNGKIIDEITGLKTAAKKHKLGHGYVKNRIKDGKPDKNGNYWSSLREIRK